MFDAMPLQRTHQDGFIGHLSAAPVLSYTPGAEIYAEGSRAGALYQVAFGVVRIYRLLADGRRQICAFHLPGEIFGFETATNRHFFADAVTAVGLRILRPGNEKDLSRELLGLALQSLTRAHDHVLTLGRTDAVGRVAGFLSEMAERQDVEGNSPVELAMSRCDIADYLGLTVETVSRALTKLRTEGYIRLLSSRQVEILKWEGLEELTN